METAMLAAPIIEAFFDEPTNTISYLVADPTTGAAAVVDPVLDFDVASGEADTRSAERIVTRAAEQVGGSSLCWRHTLTPITYRLHPT